MVGLGVEKKGSGSKPVHLNFVYKFFGTAVGEHESGAYRLERATLRCQSECRENLTLDVSLMASLCGKCQSDRIS
jgi:hypothetical protein